MDASPHSALALFMDAAHGLRPAIAAMRDQIDRERGLPNDLVEALRASGLFGLWLPKTLGGPEVPPLDFIRVIEQLAEADGSVGWCATIAAGYGRLAGSLPEDVAREIFGSGRAIVAGTINPTGKAVCVDGGYRVSGRWSYGSFIQHSDWVLGNCVVENGSASRHEAGSPELRIAFFPRRDVQVFDTWHVSGLRGTGSHDYQVEDVLVPEQYTLRLDGYTPRAREPGALYRMPMPSAFVSCIAAVPLGIARAAIDAMIELAGTKTPPGSISPLREKPMLQADVARAEALLRSGRAFMLEELQRLWEQIQSDETLSLRQRAMVRLACWQATQACVQAVDLMYAGAGGAALYEANRFERCFRDVHAVTQHVALASSNLELSGRVLLGLDPGTARF
jgi:indole-3-acetate monooxygenase